MKAPITLALPACPTPVTRCGPRRPRRRAVCSAESMADANGLHMGGHDMTLHGGCQAVIVHVGVQCRRDVAKQRRAAGLVQGSHRPGHRGGREIPGGNSSGDPYLIG
jgi:hypothetical protein